MISKVVNFLPPLCIMRFATHLEEEELYYEKKPASCRLLDYLYTFTFTVLTPHWIAFAFVGMNTSIVLPLIPPPLSAATA